MFSSARFSFSAIPAKECVGSSCQAMPNHSSGTIAVYLVEKLKPCNPFKFSAYLAGPSLRSKVALYLISYDINEKDAFEYDGLWAKLKSIGATKILYSEWVVVDEVRKANSIYDAVS